MLNLFDSHVAATMQSQYQILFLTLSLDVFFIKKENGNLPQVSCKLAKMTITKQQKKKVLIQFGATGGGIASLQSLSFFKN